MSEAETINLEIQPTKCFRLFDQSFNRVKYYTCIGDSIDVENLPTEWAIKGNRSGMSYGMNPPKQEEKERLLEDFQCSLRQYLVRDSIESFALCLDEMYFVMLLLNESKRKLAAGQSLYNALNDNEKQFLQNFRSKGLSPKDGKVGLLKQKFDLKISEPSTRIIKGLKDIRDCLSHRNGIAGGGDGFAAKGKKIKFEWLTLETFIVDKKTKAELPLIIGETYELEEGGDLCLKIKEHAKIVSVGTPLEFSSIEIYEIAQSLQWIAAEYLKQFGEKYGTK